ncbi:hypothetical protein MYX07_06715 [Patescibacteria group bacterium AH-259-L07]|nr:hypothetical protein [Patescibacteria group bacterium AH-259-L07]
MPDTKELSPEVQSYYEKVARLCEELGDKFIAANWYEKINPEKAKQLLRKVAEECLKKCSETGDVLEKWGAIRNFQEAGDDQKAREIALELIAEYEGGEINNYEEHLLKIDSSELYKKIGEPEKAEEILIEYAQEMEEKLASLPEDSKEAKQLPGRIYRVYESAGAKEEVRKIDEQLLRMIEEKTGESDSAVAAPILEGLGYKERAQRAWQKWAEFNEKIWEGKKYQWLHAIGLVHFYKKAGNVNRAEEILREAARREEERGNKWQAAKHFAKLRNRKEVKRLLQEIIEETQKQSNVADLIDALIDLNWIDNKEAKRFVQKTIEEVRKQNDIPKLIDGLRDLGWIDNNPALLEEAKELFLQYAQEKESSSDPKEKRKAIDGYVEVINILEEKRPYPYIQYLWEKRSLWNED